MQTDKRPGVGKGCILKLRTKKVLCVCTKQIVERELVRSHLTGATVPLKDNGPGLNIQNGSGAIFSVYETRMAKCKFRR